MVKLIDILKKILLESKQVGNIYHFTSYADMIDIVGDNFRLVSDDMFRKKSGKAYKEDTYISFTRDKSLRATTTVHTDVRITVNGDKMSNKYKIQPYADLDNGNGRGNVGKFDEMEERIKIDAKRYPDGINIESYIMSIDIVKKPWNTTIIKYKNELIDLLDSKNIQYNIVDKF